jgi:PAS domain S-box-containing protein
MTDARSEARFERLVADAPDGVVVLRWPTIVFANRAAAHCLGYREPEKVLGTSILSHLVQAEAQVADHRARASLAGVGRRPPVEYSGKDPDGRPLQVEVSAIPIDYDGAPAILAFVRDVTERVSLIAQLRQADRLAAVGTLAAGVAHEINNPLSYILLNIEFLQKELRESNGKDLSTPELLERLEHCQTGAERVRTIVRDLQAFTRKDENIRGPVDLGEAVRAALQFVAHELPSKEALRLALQRTPAVLGNHTRLEQLVVNLVINAIHAVREAGREEPWIEVKVTADGSREVILEVNDNGVGMTRVVLEQIFDPFFTTKAPGVGTGLGLAISDSIVRSIGGRIEVKSEPGQGTQVRVVLPAVS